MHFNQTTLQPHALSLSLFSKVLFSFPIRNKKSVELFLSSEGPLEDRSLVLSELHVTLSLPSFVSRARSGSLTNSFSSGIYLMRTRRLTIDMFEVLCMLDLVFADCSATFSQILSTSPCHSHPKLSSLMRAHSALVLSYGIQTVF